MPPFWKKNWRLLHIPTIHTAKFFLAQKSFFSFCSWFLLFFFVTPKQLLFFNDIGRFFVPDSLWLPVWPHFVGIAITDFAKQSSFLLTVPFCLSRQIHSLFGAPKITFGDDSRYIWKTTADELSPICAAAFNFGIGTHWFILFLSHWNKWPRAGLFCWTPCMPNKIRFICKKSIGMRFRWIFGSFLRTVLLQPGKNRPFTALTPPIMRF